ncbi:MAG: type II toxin-antitoxin system PemK/MazF family toxin [Chitinophagaceae bacterium]
MVIKRFEIYFVQLDPAIGTEINRIRPCVIVSPNEMNTALQTVIVAPLTSTIRNYPSRVNCFVEGKSGQIALDQLRAIDKQRWKSKLATLDNQTCKAVVARLLEIFE